MNHAVVSAIEWLVARKVLLAKEKELTRRRDELNKARLALPWVKVEKNYVFDGPEGKVTLADLFDGRSQLIVQHFMWRADQGQGCVGCSFEADHVDGALPHLEHHDVSYVRISRAPLADIKAFRKRMGWRAKWVSSWESDFNYDFHVSFTKEELAKGEVYYNYRMTEASIEELPGLSVFYRDDAGNIFHTYSSYGRGNEEVIGTYMYLDIAPKGRNENSGMDWVRHHDRYDRVVPVDCAALPKPLRTGVKE